MSDIIILMRHGKAERPKEGMLDIERRLTESGKRSLATTLPQSLGLAPKNLRMQVWSSPAARAEQTAHLMVRACKREGLKMDSDIVFKDALWSQDREAFLTDVRACDADCVIAVGHNPFIEDLTAHLSGSTIDFATGGFAAIALGAADGPEGGFAPLSGRLLWFAQGPISQRWRTLVRLERVLAESADTVVSRRDAFFEDPDDIETMHKLRVSIRTLRSLLAFVAPWQNTKQNKKAQTDLKDIVSVTSRLRELDVLAEQAQELENVSPASIEYCENAAAMERESVKHALSNKRMKRKLDEVVTMLHDVKWRKAIRANGLDAGDVRARFDKLAADLEDDLATLDLADAEQTHDVRKKAKRVRYDAENFESLIGEDAVDIAKGMTKHQDNLGAICDARVNIEIIDGFMADDIPDQVANDLSVLRAQSEAYLRDALKG